MENYALLGIIGVSILCKNCSDSFDSPTLTIDSYIKVIGSIRTHEKYNGYFILSNTSKRDILIKEITPDCYCTIAKNKISKIPVNQSDTLFFSYDASYPGPFQQKITIKSNAINSPLLLVIRGKAR